MTIYVQIYMYRYIHLCVEQMIVQTEERNIDNSGNYYMIRFVIYDLRHKIFVCDD